jgi:hypothetical protein
MRPEDLMSPEQVAEVQEQLGALAIAAVGIDLEGFLLIAELVSSPQAAAHGINLRALESAAQWFEMARRLKPFRDEAITRLEQIRKEDSCG